MDQLRHHRRVVIAGGGVSGLTALIQLKRRLGLGVGDVQLYDKGSELGGTWATNTYPGATCDIPISLYSLSFSPAKEFDSQWPAAHEILGYWRRVVAKYNVAESIKYRHVVLRAEFSRVTNLWTLTVKDLARGGETRVETCNVFVSAVGALSTPADAPFDTSRFTGRVVHTGTWDPALDLDNQHVVVLGNGCSAAQFVPAVVDKVAKLTQIARSAHAIVPPVYVPDNSWTNFLVRWIPGLFTLFRFGVFMMCESYFWMNAATDQAEKGRRKMKKLSDRYIEKTAPEKYWDALKYDFEFGQKRRVIDFKGYTSALHSPKVTLIKPDTISTAVGRTVTTANGVVVEDVDVVVLSTGFKVTDYLFPLEVVNGDGERLVERLKRNGVKTYLTSMVASYPNFFILMGPNSVTGHSSVLFNTECTVDMMINLLGPVFNALSTTSALPLVVTRRHHHLRRNDLALDGRPSLSTSLSSSCDDESESEEKRRARSRGPIPNPNPNREFSTSPVDEKFDFNRHADADAADVPTPPASSPASSAFPHHQPALVYAQHEEEDDDDDDEVEQQQLDEQQQLGRTVYYPTVQVTEEAEDEWYESMRKEMESKIWESKPLPTPTTTRRRPEGEEGDTTTTTGGRRDDDKISWYIDREQGGKCTQLYPWSQIHFKLSTETIVKDRFVWSACS